ncbi:hypothetical protein Ciccas_005496, partial [Cichlidogyrus casuarinus]
DAEFSSITDVLKKVSEDIRLDSLQQVFEQVNLVRPIGSANHAVVRKRIVENLSRNNWDIEQVTFEQETPIGTKRFTNILASYKKKTFPKTYALSCHYDSLSTVEDFYGSIDSAMPCAMILEIARIYDKYYNSIKPKIGLEIYIFDGEEAFQKWSRKDSTYGSRHLANALLSTSSIPGSAHTELDRIELFILLDLLGATNTILPNFELSNKVYYEELQKIEKQMISEKLLHSNFAKSGRLHFGLPLRGASIEDDHIPFLDKGVPVLHMIAYPFPEQWHKVTDNAANIDFEEALDLTKIFTTFILRISMNLFA